MEKEFLKELVAFIQSKGFVWGPSPEIYGGASGFYEYGPLGKLLKNQVENKIRKTFQQNGYFEVECPSVMPKAVWEASGHLGGFTDPMILCSKCKTSYRVDHIISEKYPDTQVHKEEYLKFIQEKKIKCPSCGNDFEQKIVQHSLMMRTTIGTDTEAYNRPETATTTYLPFIRYYDFFRKKLPFGVFQIGKAFRNEISPRQHMVRMREFTQAEAQVFVDPESKKEWSKFEEVKNESLPLWKWEDQEKGQPKSTKLSEAIEKGTFKNKAYAWTVFMAYRVFKELGIPEEKIRLRQHAPDEKAFYADDAWDLEIDLRSFGWTECCGIHDRTDYDLKQHAAASKKTLEAFDEASGRKFVPHILEIAFGSDRPTFALLDIFYDKKEKDEGKTVLKIPLALAPIQVGIFPLMKKEELVKMAQEVYKELNQEFICFYDETAAIGKRYLRAAEAGIPFCLTIDFDTLTDKSVTIRDRDSEAQVRVKISDLNTILQRLFTGEAFSTIK
ncbi:MAG: glycine--tRNA ligase [Nanoarchaeota archaeon]